MEMRQVGIPDSWQKRESGSQGIFSLNDPLCKVGLI